MFKNLHRYLNFTDESACEKLRIQMNRGIGDDMKEMNNNNNRQE
jgi:hypothetical protein